MGGGDRARRPRGHATSFASAGIRALPLKGSLLARRASYGDVAARSSIDVDVLVAPERSERRRAAALWAFGWR